MQIKIEIDVKPEELRRFLGLPDVAGLQDDVVRFLRQKVGAAGESFDPSAMVQGSLDLIKRTPAWRRFKDVMAARVDDVEAGADAEPEIEVTVTAKPAARKKTSPKKTAATRRKARRGSATAAASAPGEPS